MPAWRKVCTAPFMVERHVEHAPRAMTGAEAVQDASAHPGVNPDGETGPVSRTVTRDRSFFYDLDRRFVREGGRFGPIQRNKAYSRTEAETAPRAPSVGAP
jgi:hypothetical protein